MNGIKNLFATGVSNIIQNVYSQYQSVRSARRSEWTIWSNSTLLMGIRETYLTSLEDRLNRMEAVMAQSGLSLPGKETKSNSLDDASMQDIPDQLSLLKIFDDGTTLFIGTYVNPPSHTVTYIHQGRHQASQSLATKA